MDERVCKGVRQLLLITTDQLVDEVARAVILSTSQGEPVIICRYLLLDSSRANVICEVNVFSLADEKGTAAHVARIARVSPAATLTFVIVD